MLMRGGEMQKILFFLSRFVAKTIPTDIETGKAAGIAVVIKFKALRIAFFSDCPIFILDGTVAIMLAKATIAMMPTNLMLSW